jgi:exonuclease SbcC
VQEFLSVFLPGFFSGLEPKDAKAILARYSDVSPDEVYQTLMAKEKEALGSMTLGMGFDSIEVIRKNAAAQKKEAEAEKLRLEGEVRLADDALKAGEPNPFTSKITDAHRSTALQYRQALAEYDVKVKNRAQTIQTLTKQKELLGKTFETLRAGLVAVESVETICPTCKQSLPHEHLEAVKVNVVAKNHELKEQINALITQGNEIKAEIERLQTTDAEPEHVTKMREWLARFETGEQQERDQKAAYDAALKAYNDAKTSLTKRGEWMAQQEVIIQQAAAKLDAVKAFRFNYVKAQQHKLDKMFDKVKIILSKVNEDGEIKEEFLITWNGKPYQILSKSEKVRCDIEIGKAIAALRMNAEPMPTFVDDAEGVQRLFDEQFAGQVIAAYVFDSELIVKSYDETVNDIEDELRSFRTLIVHAERKGA